MSPSRSGRITDSISVRLRIISLNSRMPLVCGVNGRMCSGLLQGRLLKMIVEMIRPERVLELGTFSGFSALCIAEALKGEATLDTIEIDDELEDFIRRNLSSSECGERVTLHMVCRSMRERYSGWGEMWSSTYFVSSWFMSSCILWCPEGNRLPFHILCGRSR